MSAPKNKTTTLLFVVAAASLVLMANCKKNPVTPKDEPPRNPREYVWSIDTLSYPNSFQTYMYDIWGSDAKNLYAVGHNDRGLGKMYLFNGAVWEDVKLSTVQGGNIYGPIDLKAIHGFGPNDIWAVGEHVAINPNPPPYFIDSSLVIHYNGSYWFEVKDSVLLTGGYLQTVWGTSSSNLWTGGWKATLFHYNGSHWQKLPLPVPSRPQTEVIVRSITGTSTGDFVYLLITIGDTSTIPFSEYYYFVQYANNAFTIVDVDSIVLGHYEHEWGHQAFWYSPWNKLYSVGDARLFEWTGESWRFIQRFKAEVENVYGASPDNFYVVGQYGQVWHYNGANWQQFIQFEAPDVPIYSGIWTDGKEVFIVGYNTNDTLVLHGK